MSVEEQAPLGEREAARPDRGGGWQATARSLLIGRPETGALFGAILMFAFFAVYADNFTTRTSLAGLASITAELGKKGDIRVSAYDMTEDLLKEIDAGTLVSTIDQQQYLQGYEPIHWLQGHIDHGFVIAPGVDMLTGPALVDKSNASQVAEGVKAGFR